MPRSGCALGWGLFAARPSAGRGWPTNRAHGPQRGPPDGYTPGGAARELVAARSGAAEREVARYSLLRAIHTSAVLVHHECGSDAMAARASNEISVAERSLKLLPASNLRSRITLLEDAVRACRAELQRRPSHCQEASPPQPTASSSSCMLLQLGHDEMGVVTHELCDPVQPLPAVNLSSTAKGLLGVGQPSRQAPHPRPLEGARHPHPLWRAADAPNAPRQLGQAR